jgi:hypothetical protein
MTAGNRQYDHCTTRKKYFTKKETFFLPGHGKVEGKTANDTIKKDADNG